MRHFVFWVPEADEKLQAIITTAEMASDRIGYSGDRFTAGSSPPAGDPRARFVPA